MSESRCPTWLKLVLVLSLVLNVAVVGLFAGQMMKDRGKHRGPERQISWILKFVPDARRSEAEALFDSKRDAMRALYRERGKNLDQIVDAIRAEPFAPETLEAAIKARRANSAERRAIVEDTLIELIATFDKDERVHFAAELEERLRKWKQRRASRD